MKVLMVCSHKWVFSERANHFVAQLISGLIECGHQVDCGLDLFWNCYSNYDLLFFQWPESIFNWDSKQIELKKIALHFEDIKNKGIKTVITCHNLHPHNNDKLTSELYNFLYSQVDAIHHMGEYSYIFMKKKFPHKFHFIVPHHIPQRDAKHFISSKIAKQQLNIPEKSIVISSFGAFRNREEVELFINLAKHFWFKGITFLAPRLPIGYLYNGKRFDKSFVFIYNRIFNYLLRIRTAGFLTDKDLELWLSASDIVFIQRKDILNSGNIPLAYSAGKIVVGPDRGNVGEIIRGTGNFVFDPFKRTTIKSAMKSAINALQNGNELGKNNKNIATKYWNVSTTSHSISKYLDIIKEL